MLVEALYDFEPTSNVELGFRAGERLIVVRQDVGDGWWEGKKVDQHTTGLFPASYVKVIDVPDGGGGVSAGNDSHFFPTLPPPPPSVEEETASDQASVANFTSFTAETQGTSGVLNSRHQCRIIFGPRWQSAVEPLTLTVSNPQKDSKFSGIKHFIVYEVKTNVSAAPVRRRYKHFLWLHDQFTELFPGVCIPPLPEKQITGRFDVDFIRQRQQALEAFLCRVARHPLLAASHAFAYFLAASEGKDWKSAKQSVKRSLVFNRPHGKFVGPIYLNDIEYPPGNVPHDRLQIIERFGKYRHCLEKNVKGLLGSCDQLSASTTALSAAYSGFGRSMVFLATGQSAGERQGSMEVENWCWRKDCSDFAALMQGIHGIGVGMAEIQTLVTEQSGETQATMCQTLREYSVLLPSLAAAALPHKEASDRFNAMQARRERETKESMVAASEVEQSQANVLLAEFDHYHCGMLRDFRQMMSAYMQKQIELHQKMLDKWVTLQGTFDRSFSGSS
ncbi:sorting nexin-33-like [Oscarella lobularis]|uniref:sorting nexin-33-like n=1 Tax=Oscarella lobularis TaxID=121494 RepID=UPI00331351F5